MENSFHINTITTKGMKVIPELTKTEIKALFGCLQTSENNIVDLKKTRKQILEIIEISDSTFRNKVSNLIMRGILTKTGATSVYFIDPLYFLNGDKDKIYSYAESIEKARRNRLGIE